MVKDIRELKDVDVAILATPTRSCEEYANQILPLGINTVDSFDIHTQIRGYRERLMKLNKETNTVSVIAAGWDPGSDSIVRTLMQSLAPKGGPQRLRTLKGWCEERFEYDHPPR